MPKVPHASAIEAEYRRVISVPMGWKQGGTDGELYVTNSKVVGRLYAEMAGTR